AAVLVFPRLHHEVTFKIRLVALLQILFGEVGQFAATLSRFAAVECLAVDEAGIVDPLASGLVLLAVVDGEADLRDLAPIAERADFRVAGQSTNQHYLVDISHGEHSSEEAFERTSRTHFGPESGVLIVHLFTAACKRGSGHLSFFRPRLQLTIRKTVRN